VAPPAATGFLRTIAASVPTVLVLEDVHDADRGTLDLLVHLSRQLVGTRLLVIATYRDVAVDRAHPSPRPWLWRKDSGTIEEHLARRSLRWRERCGLRGRATGAFGRIPGTGGAGRTLRRPLKHRPRVR